MALTDQKLVQGSDSIQGLVAANKFHKSLPSQYAYFENSHESIGRSGDEIPIIDYSLLISTDCQQCPNKMIKELGKACHEWSFFIVINHGLPESVTNALMEGTRKFFSMEENELLEYMMNKDVVNGIRVGSSGHSTIDNSHFWRNYIKTFLRPQFQSPNKPEGFWETLMEFNKKQREIKEELLKAISKSLELEECYISRITEGENGTDFCVINMYPPCPQPELAVGVSPHTDFGLLILLMQNGVDGLQIQRNGKWFNVNAPPNSIMVGIGDQMEILTNKKYKSVVHRVTLKDKTTRMSIATFYGPSFDTVVVPAQDFVDEDNLPAYRGMKYIDYYTLDQCNKSKGITSLDMVRI